jgi:hypothetical protein
MSDYYDGFGGSQRHHMTHSGASINELLDNKDLRRALFCERELTKNLRLDIQNLDAKRQGAIDSLREHIHLLHKTQSELAQAEERLKRIDAVQVPEEPDDSYWENEAKRYAGNADYWRDRAEAAESKLAAIKRIGEVKNGCVLWHNQNPHAFPNGTVFYVEELK